MLLDLLESISACGPDIITLHFGKSCCLYATQVVNGVIERCGYSPRPLAVWVEVKGMGLPAYLGKYDMQAFQTWPGHLVTIVYGSDDEAWMLDLTLRQVERADIGAIPPTLQAVPVAFTKEPGEIVVKLPRAIAKYVSRPEDTSYAKFLSDSNMEHRIGVATDELHESVCR